MKLGIIGKPQSGKTTVFNAASGHQEAVGDYSQASHRAIIKVPDQRVDQLAEIVQPKKKTYAEIEFLDSAGFTGKGKDSSSFEISPDLRQMEAFLVVIDAFSSDAKPMADLQDLIDEMILADQVLIETNIEKRERKVNLTGDKSELAEINLLKRCLGQLETEKPLIDLDLSDSEWKMLRGYQFLSAKPLIITLNVAEDDIERIDQIKADYTDFEREQKSSVTALCGKIEMELVGLDDEERQVFLTELGIKTPAVEKVIQTSYALLGLISYLTAGEPEVRAWTIRRGTSAQKAAGVIHSDIERGFIRAEVTAYDDYIEHKTAAALKAAGKTRLEGKEYIVADGDVILFRFNV